MHTMLPFFFYLKFSDSNIKERASCLKFASLDDARSFRRMASLPDHIRIHRSADDADVTYPMTVRG